MSPLTEAERHVGLRPTEDTSALMLTVLQADIDREAMAARLASIADEPEPEVRNKPTHHEQMRAVVSATYLRSALTPILRRRIIKGLCGKLKGLDFDTVVFRGASGCLIGPAVADKLGKHMLYIRKDKEYEDSHSSHMCEGHTRLQRYIIVDDFISSGYTVDSIIKAVEVKNSKAVCVTIALYSCFSQRTTYERLLCPPCNVFDPANETPEFQRIPCISGHVDETSGKFRIHKS